MEDISIIDSLRLTASWALLVLAALPVAFLSLLTIASFLPARVRATGDPSHRLVVLIPAHNESLLITDTVKGALAQDYPAEAFSVVVIADNCDDDTADKARACGVRVIERHENPGKGQALHEALELLIPEGADAFLILDADSQAHPETLREIDRLLAEGAKAIQVRGGVINPGESIRTRALQVGLASYLGLRPRGKDALGISCGTTNGLCLSREAVEKVPHVAHSIVEDLEYHLMLLQAGYRVRFADRVWIKQQMPTTAKDSEVQRIRWERGRMAMIKHYVPSLLRRTLKGDRLALEALLDVVIPPVSLIVLAILAGGLLGMAIERWVALVLFVALGLHYLVASWRYGSLKDFVLVALYSPWYIIWKTYVVLVSLVRQRTLGWNRTPRHVPKDGHGDE